MDRMASIPTWAGFFFVDFIECFTTTFLRAHSWLNWVGDLGWGIVGVIDKNYNDQSDPIGVSHHVPTFVSPQLSDDKVVHLYFTTNINKSADISEMMFELDFSECYKDNTFFFFFLLGLNGTSTQLWSFSDSQVL